MKKRLLIINCSSPYFLYIPMGSFGLCDYLDRRGIAASIFNPALYGQHRVQELLLEQLASYAPTHIGLVLHWQETAHGMLDILQTIRSWSSEVPIICGGFTAGFFGKDLLTTCPDIDYLIQGDPEEPLCQLLEGAPPLTIPNLIHRHQGAIIANEEHWLIDEATLDSLSFACLDFLRDAPLYIDKINAKLGFPVFIGRGCVFNCEYCGGSRYAFTSHSNRIKSVSRSVDAVLCDLRQLKPLTDSLYICYENDLSYITRLFQAIGQDPSLKGHFKLNYGAWHLLSPEFLHLYKEAFQLNSSKRPVIEFSPEVYDDISRTTIKGGGTYTLDDLIANIDLTDQTLAGKVLIDTFFSRYHATEATAEAVYQEIYNIFYLKHLVWNRFQHAVHVSYDHLSTDVGSRYWQQHVDQPSKFNTLLDNKQLLDGQCLYPFPVDNLCFYIPSTISHHQRLEIESFVQVLEGIEQHCFELYQILSACLATIWFDTIRSLTDRYVEKRHAEFFENLPLQPILEELGELLADDPAGDMPYIRDLVRFSVKKLQRQSPLLNDFQQAKGAGYYVLNQAAISIHEHDYPDVKNFLLRLQEYGKDLNYQRTVCIFMDATVITLPHAAYRATLKKFIQPKRLDSYLDSLSNQADFDTAQHQIFLEQLIESGVLRSSPPPD